MLSEDVDEELIVTVRRDAIVTMEWAAYDFNKTPLTDNYENHDRKQSWSDAVDEEFEGMDFSAPVIFNDDEDLLRLEKEKENIEQKDFNLTMAKIQEKKISNIPPTVLRMVAIQTLVSVLTTVPPSDNLVIIVQRLYAHPRQGS